MKVHSRHTLVFGTICSALYSQADSVLAADPSSQHVKFWYPFSLFPVLGCWEPSCKNLCTNIWFHFPWVHTNNVCHKVGLSKVICQTLFKNSYSDLWSYHQFRKRQWSHTLHDIWWRLPFITAMSSRSIWHYYLIMVLICMSLMTMVPLIIFIFISYTCRYKGLTLEYVKSSLK